MTTTYNITYNAQYDSHEVTFESKPATAVLDALKALKMRWNPKKACWYGFAKEHEIINAILENGEGETITGEKTEGATVYTDGYLGGGAVYGSKSNLHLYGADLSKAIREDIKRAGIKGVTVRCKSYSGGQSIGVTVTLRPDEFVSLAEYVGKYEITPENTWIYTGNGEPIFVDYYFGQLSAREQEETRVAAAEYAYERMTTRENRVNEFYIDEETHFTPETLAKIKTIQAIICAYRYDDSNSQVDYFHTNFYYDIYTKPAAVKPTSPDDEPTKPTKDEPKEEPAAEETAPVQPAEQAQESAKAPRYQVIVNDDRYGGLDEKLDYSRITDARKAMRDYVNKEDWESAAIYDRKSGEIVETYGEYFPVDQINVRAKAQEHESVVESVVESAEAPAETEDEPETVPEYPKYYVESFFTGWKRVTKEQYENWREHVRNGATAQTKEGIENILARRTRVIFSAEEDTPENNPLYVAYNIPNQSVPTPKTKKEMLTAIFEDQIERGTMIGVLDDIGEYAEYKAQELSVRECREWYNAAFNEAALPKTDYSETINKAKSALIHGGYDCAGVMISHRTNKREFTVIRYSVRGTDEVTDKLAALNIIGQIHAADGISFEAYAEVVPADCVEEKSAESAGDVPAEAPETVGFHPIINNLPQKSKWDVWNVHPDEYLSSCVVPLVRCNEDYHVLDTVYLKVDTPEEVKTLMSAAAVGNRQRWPKYNKQYRRETIQRAADIIEKYYI